MTVSNTLTKLKVNSSHPKEVLNNKMREINNNLMLNDSPIFTIKKAGEKANIKAMTFDIEIESI